MILFKKAAALQKYLQQQGKEGKKTGFVPTMGALHPGHLSLVNRCRQENGCSVASIFVNPTQFNDATDFQKYPVTIEEDIRLLESGGCDVLFLPDRSEIYPGGVPEQEHYDLGYLETVLEGRFRPGHFQGVCMVVRRLLDIVRPDRLYLGQKDYQQCMVIRRLIALSGREKTTTLVISPTLREAGGLAMSSRNMRLTPDERKTAEGIYQTLLFVKDHLAAGNLQSLKAGASTLLVEGGFRPDYVEIADAADLRPVENWDGHTSLVALTAAYLNEVRLIDNLLLN